MSDKKILTKPEDCLPCPFCGGKAVIHGEGMVACENMNSCGGEVDYGHWCGTENGIPAIHHVIESWNQRVESKELTQATTKIDRLCNALLEAADNLQSVDGAGSDTDGYFELIKEIKDNE